MADAPLTVTYDGPALTTGRIPVRDLAPALLAFGELVTEASAIIYPDREPAALSITTTETGSFAVHLILSMADGTTATITELLTSDTTTALANLQAVLIGGGGSLFALIRVIRRRKIKKQEPVSTPGYVKVTLDDGTVIEARGEALELYVDTTVRQNARDVVRPLESTGIHSMRLHSPTTDPVVIDDGDLEAFELPDIDETVVRETETEMLVEIAAPTFRANNKWRLSNGTSGSFWATIGDSAFLDNVNAGEPFRKGDTLRCLVKVTQSQGPTGLRAQHHIIKVLQHVARGQQLRIDDAA